MTKYFPLHKPKKRIVLTQLESQSKKYFFILLFVLFFPQVVIFFLPFVVEYTNTSLLEYASLIMSSANYISRIVLLVFLFSDLKVFSRSRIRLIVPLSALFVPFIAAAIYFITAFLYKPENHHT